MGKRGEGCWKEKDKKRERRRMLDGDGDERRMLEGGEVREEKDAGRRKRKSGEGCW